MFDLSKSDVQLLEISEQQFQNAVREAEFLRSVRHAAILESHGVPGDTPGRFVRNSEKGYSFLEQEPEKALADTPAETGPEPQADGGE